MAKLDEFDAHVALIKENKRKLKETINSRTQSKHRSALIRWIDGETVVDLSEEMGLPHNTTLWQALTKQVGESSNTITDYMLGNKEYTP